MMRIQQLVAAATVMFLTSAGAAYAGTITIDLESISVTATGTDAPTINPIFLSSGSGVAIPGPGEKNFFTANPVSGSGTITDTIHTSFTFAEYNGSTLVATGSLTQTGTFMANYSGSLSCSSSTGQSDCIYWVTSLPTFTNSPTDTLTTDGSTYSGTGDQNNRSSTPSLTDTVRLSNGDTLSVSFYDAQDWDITPGISFAPGTSNRGLPSTPLPATLPLLATGLGALGLLGWRKKRKVSAIAAAA